MSLSIHQFLAGAGVGDAITNYVLEIQKIFHESNIKSLIFCPEKHIAKEYKNKKVFGINEVFNHVDEETLIIYHYSIGSELTKIFSSLKCKKAICYHNVTPKEFYKNLSQEQALKLEEGRNELKSIKDITDLASAVSEYNRKELFEMGFKNTAFIPLIFSREYLSTLPDENLMSRYNDDKVNFLFVGRVVPNKRFEDIIKVFSVYHHTINSKSRLFLVGSYIGNEKYYTFLKSLVFDARLTDSVVFSGHVTLNELIGYYKLASLFLCMSWHEGFGLPLIESMYFKIPVFALDRAAVSETLGGAGVLLKGTNYLKIAELINHVLKNTNLLDEVIKNQNKRFEFFSVNTLKIILKDLLYKNFALKI